MIRVRRCRRAVVAAALLALAAPRARATVLVPVDLGELVSSARSIVHGRVVSTSAQWLEERRSIETVVTLAVEDTLKGGASGSITFRVPGGEMGRYRSIVPGAPAFAEGDDVVVFLGGEGPSIPHLVGFSQGVYRVRAIGGERMVRPAVPSPATESTPMLRGTGRVPARLAAFEDEVRALVVAGGAR
jgi:hypothetical protein